jgi:2-isopropylmalate synthase
VTVRIRRDDKTYVGRGADTDIVVASAKALLNALNRVLAVQRPADTDVRASP